MAWPKATDFIEAVQDLRLSMEDEELRRGEVARTPLGLPMLWSGNFADVFKIHCPATGNTWALKCFTRRIPGLQERYRRIAACLEWARLPFTVDFQYLAQGLRIGPERLPVLKMRWVEGQTLNHFVEEHLDRPANLKMLSDLWVKLAFRLREAEIAHADLQHGNVLLVPASGGALALRLIDYDGMYIPALADLSSGEVGHPAYQHPQRLRDGTYNAEVDRFSHLAIYTAIRCLMARGSELWQRFNNGENLLFREQDFRSPAESDLFQCLWTNPPDADAQTLLGRVVLACRTRLDEVPLLDEVVSCGRIPPLTLEQEAAVRALLSPRRAVRAEPFSEEEIPLEWLAPTTKEPLADEPLTVADLQTRTVALTEANPPPSFRSASSWLCSMEEWLPRGAAAAAHILKGLSGRILGKGNDLLRRPLWVALFTLLIVVVWFAVNALWVKSTSPLITKEETAGPAIQLKLNSVMPQAVEAGKLLRLVISVENAETWNEKMQYSLAGRVPSGARIDPQSGEFSWTPSGEAVGKHDLTVSVEGSDGHNDSTSFVVNVVEPLPPLRLEPIAAQTVKAGEPLAVAITVENAKVWGGRLQYHIVGHSLPGARIDLHSGEFCWTPPRDKTAGKYNVVVSARAPDGLADQRVFEITVTRPILAPPNPVLPDRIVLDLGNDVKLELVLIPAGEFLMGSPDSDIDAWANEKPQHRVRITKPFYLGKYEVTQEQWQAVMGNNPSPSKGPKNPVVMVSWDDCQVFLRKIPAEFVAGPGRFALPTEAQWEYACRAGSTTKYCFGNDDASLGQSAWYDENSDHDMHPVGEKKPNAWGLYDMHGNVFELCADLYDGYHQMFRVDDPTGPATVPGSIAARVVRGGSWDASPRNSRSALRIRCSPGGRRDNTGFRVSLVPAESSSPTAPLRLQPIAHQTVEAGKPLALMVSVENTEVWSGKVRFGFVGQVPPGARIDPQSGEFTWTPPNEAIGKYHVTVSVYTPDGRTDQSTFTLRVMKARIWGDKLTFDLGNDVTLELVLIPAGEFQMGSADSDNTAPANEKPQHPIRITQPFYLGKYEVTQEQWQAVMGNNPSKFQGPKNPVENVSWADCQEFLEKLTAKSGLGQGRFVLPTEAQWEYACRAGSKTLFCFGNDEWSLGDYAWSAGNSGGKSHPVGEKRPNSWGVYDMHGNVMEWCADWYDANYYGPPRGRTRPGYKGHSSRSPATPLGPSPLNPTGPKSGKVRVLRGGSWGHGPNLIRSACRGGGTPDDRSGGAGLRVAWFQ